MARIFTLIGFLICFASMSKAQTIADFSMNDTVFCIGDTLILTDLSSTSNGTITSWSWRVGNFWFSNNQNPMMVIGSFMYDSISVGLKVTTSTGDSDSTTKQIFVTYVEAGADRSICTGDTAHLNAISINTASYQWAPNTGLSCSNCPNPVASPNSTTMYTVTATDSFGCVVNDTLTVNVFPKPIILTPSQTICDSLYSLIAQPSGGSWSGSGIAQNGVFNPILAGPGNHMIYYTSNCGIDSVLLTVGGSFQPYYNINIDSCGLNTGSIILDSISGGTQNFTYNWFTGNTVASLYNLSAGVYDLTITDAVGCSNTYSFTIGSYPNASLSITGPGFINNQGCIGNPLNLIATPANQDTTGYSVDWLPIANAINDTFFSTSGLLTQSGNYGFIISDSFGCATTIQKYITGVECVWPGDANSDGIANNMDILNIGIAFGSNGFDRDSISINWLGYNVINWNSFFADSTNYKHADCNGDSIVNFKDTVAVSINYGKTHLKRFANGAFTDPPLFVDQPDTVYPSQLVESPIIFGEVSNAVQNAYGVAFTITYDKSLIDSGSFNLIPATSWMGTLGGDLLKFQKDNYSDGTFDVAYVRTNQQNIPVGFGQIGKLSYILQDDISGKTAAVKPLVLSIVNIRAISLDESEITVFGQSDTTNVALYPKGINLPENSFLYFYPNPVKDDWLNYKANIPLKAIEIYNISGKVLYKYQMTGEKSGKINLENLENGVYFIKAYSKETSAIHKVILNR